MIQRHDLVWRTQEKNECHHGLVTSWMLMWCWLQSAIVAAVHVSDANWTSARRASGRGKWSLAAAVPTTAATDNTPMETGVKVFRTFNHKRYIFRRCYSYLSLSHFALGIFRKLLLFSLSLKCLSICSGSHSSRYDPNTVLWFRHFLTDWYLIHVDIT